MEDGATVALRLSIEDPVDRVTSVNLDAKWVESSSAGNFKSRINKNRKHDFYPLFKLVLLMEGDISTGVIGNLC